MASGRLAALTKGLDAAMEEYFELVVPESPEDAVAVLLGASCGADEGAWTGAGTEDERSSLAAACGAASHADVIHALVACQSADIAAACIAWARSRLVPVTALEAELVASLFQHTRSEGAWGEEEAVSHFEFLEALRTGDAYARLDAPGRALAEQDTIVAGQVAGRRPRALDSAAPEFDPVAMGLVHAEAPPQALPPIWGPLTMGQRLGLDSLMHRLASAGCSASLEAVTDAFREAGGDTVAAEGRLRELGLLAGAQRLGSAPRVEGAAERAPREGLSQRPDGSFALVGHSPSRALLAGLMRVARRVADWVPQVDTGSAVSASYAKAQAGGDGVAATVVHSASPDVAEVLDVHGLHHAEARAAAVRRARAQGPRREQQWLVVVAGVGKHSGARSAGGMAASVAQAFEEDGWVALGGNGRLGPRGTEGGLVMVPLWIHGRAPGSS
ncbi:hypothetical protein FNF28_03600 [Cafeteria roenbergensis]|uniref:Smr domain-containing protein n=1 Tax=Cafeteria roenbergensis TaxID=33653 RepID=A0A5A8DHW6_CAFRO|nr:hypothetical protein FNF28_03600 [Cafeteria roenbergensis]